MEGSDWQSPLLTKAWTDSGPEKVPASLYFIRIIKVLPSSEFVNRGMRSLDFPLKKA